MNFFKELKDCLGRDPEATTSPSHISQESPLFVYIRIPGDLDPFDRHEQFAEPLQTALDQENLGCVTGGGSLLAPADDDSDVDVEFCGIDVDLYHPEQGLSLLRRELIRLQVPAGTTLLYKLEGHEWEEPVYRMES